MLRRCGSGWDMKGDVDYNHKNAPGIHHSGDVMDDAAKRGTHKMNLTMADISSDVEWLAFSLSAYNCDSIAKYPTPSLSLKNAETVHKLR